MTGLSSTEVAAEAAGAVRRNRRHQLSLMRALAFVCGQPQNPEIPKKNANSKTFESIFEPYYAVNKM